MSARHVCRNGGPDEWMTCTVCDGRLHETGCTTRKNKHQDCCKERHQMLYDQGQHFGIDDSSQPMIPPGGWPDA